MKSILIAVLGFGLTITVSAQKVDYFKLAVNSDDDLMVLVFISQHLKEHPNDDNAFEVQGNALMGLERYDEAIVSFGKSLYYFTEDSLSNKGARYYAIGLCYALLDDKESSCANMETSSFYNFKPAKEFQKKYCLKQCIAITQQGTQCKHNASKGKEYCWQHDK